MIKDRVYMLLIATLAWLVAFMLLASAADENIDSMIASVFFPNGIPQNNQQKSPNKKQPTPGGVGDSINQGASKPMENHWNYSNKTQPSTPGGVKDLISQLSFGKKKNLWNYRNKKQPPTPGGLEDLINQLALKEEVENQNVSHVDGTQ